MTNGSIMAWIWNFYNFLGLIPKPNSGWTNKIALTLWLILIITTGVFIGCFDFYSFGKLFTISDTITYMLIDVLIPLQSLLIIKELVSLAELLRDLKTTSIHPKYPFYSLTLTIMHLTSYAIVMYNEIRIAKDKIHDTIYKLHFVVMGLQFLLNFLLISAARLVIGVAVNKLCTSMEDSLPTAGAENIQITVGPIVLEHKKMKTKLSFLLFIMFTVDTILLISFAYYIFKFSLYGFIPYLIYIMLQLSYIAYALDDCYSTLKSSLPTLRYSCAVYATFRMYTK